MALDPPTAPNAGSANRAGLASAFSDYTKAVKKRNVTVAKPESEERVDQLRRYRLAVKELLEDAHQGYDWGIGDRPNWVREELHSSRP